MEETSQQFFGAICTFLSTSDVLSSQTARYNKNEAYREQSIFSELQQALHFSVNRQQDVLEESVLKAKSDKAAEIDNLYQERNKLVW